MKTICAWLSMGFASLSLAQAVPPFTEDPSVRIAAERQEIATERLSIDQVHDARVRDCWQRFAVNGCLQEVRRSRRAQLDPVRKRELALNAQERAWRTHQREERLREKSEKSEHQP